MLPRLDDASFDAVASALASFEPFATVALSGSLLTVPSYATACVRLEALVNLAFLHCKGCLQPDAEHLRTWIDDLLGEHGIARSEDPLEDVFVSAVVAPGGVYRILEGTWERNDGHLQDAIDCLYALPESPARTLLLQEVRALLLLSECLCERRNLARWLEPDQVLPRRAVLSATPPPPGLADAVIFTASDLAALELSIKNLAPFIVAPSSPAVNGVEAPPFERRPLARFGDSLVLAAATSVSAAIRARILTWAAEHEALLVYQDAIARHQTARVFDALGVDGLAPQVPEALSLLGERPTGVSVDEAVFAVDTDKLAHVVILHDDLLIAAQTRIGAMAVMPDEVEYALASYIHRSASVLAAHSPGGGMTLVVFAGLGRGRAISLPRLETPWCIDAAGVDDLITLVQSPEWDLLRVWRLLWHREVVEANGLVLNNFGGLLNLAAYWEYHGMSLVPGDVPYPTADRSAIMVGTDFVRGLRARRRREDDVHAVAFDSSRSFPVRRITARTPFRALRERPMYGVTDAAAQGVLLGVVETRLLSVWVIASAPDVEGAAQDWVFQLWDASLTWIDVLMDVAAPYIPHGAVPVHIHLRITEPAEWGNIDVASLASRPSSGPTSRRVGHRNIQVTFSPGFLALLARPTNDAEQAMVLEFVRHLPALLGGTELNPWPTPEALVDQCFHGPDARQMHLLKASSPTDRMARDGTPNPLFIPPEERAAWELGLAWHVRARPRDCDPTTDQLIEESSDSVRLLHGLVEVTWEGLRQVLEELDLESLIRAALENAEELHRDRERWRRTARALMSMPTTRSEAARVAAEREGARGLAVSTCRILVEMAVCTCPRIGGRAVSRHASGTLMAGVAPLLELASDADALRDGPPAPGIRLRPNGFVEVEQPWLEDVAAPYVRASFNAGWEAAIANYEHHVAGWGTASGTVDSSAAGQASSSATIEGDQPGSSSAPSKAEGASAAASELALEDASFDAAFAAEYGLTRGALAEAVAEIVGWGIEREEMVFVCSREELTARLTSLRDFTPEQTSRLIESFALVPRPRWDEVPPGYTGADWYPWRFRRRLSLMTRRLVLLDDHGTNPAEGGRLVISVGQMVASYSYLVSRLRAGWLQQAFVSTTAMKSYLGAAADRHGAEFTQQVATACRAAGWEARTEVNMTQLGAGAEFGDLDVVAWKKGDPRLLCIECKRLRPALTVSEILEVLMRFRGQAKDLLAKHLARIEWLRGNMASVSLGLREPVSDLTVSPLLVTNSVVPMQFVADLPLPNEQILPVSSLAALLQGEA
ncbi:MAG TPA: hypothetical protein VFK04_04965 [Gemmatimonadaceae bacterium]|nr:hypothetical protein [Gemmatimonadaceae bacterium]